MSHKLFTPIRTLFFSRGPSTIARFIGAVIVDAVNRFSIGSVAHVFVKVGERLPSFTDIYSSAAIIFKGFDRWILAPLEHRIPYVIQRCFRLPVCLHVLRHPQVPQTATGLGMSVPQIGPIDGHHLSAVASAQPAALALRRRSTLRSNCQPSKTLPNQIQWLHRLSPVCLVVFVLMTAHVFTLAYVKQEVVTVATAAVGFTAANIQAGGGHPQATQAVCRLAAGEVRFAYDGTAPTSTVGTLLEIGDQVVVTGNDVMQSFLAIRTGSTSGVLTCNYTSP